MLTNRKNIMNGKIKFHKVNGPAFNIGEVWVDSAGHEVTITSVTQFKETTGANPSDYDVEYTYAKYRGAQSKDGWSFQTRFTHKADLAARI